MRGPVAVSLDDQPDVRVSDAERQLVVDRLREETAAGRLTLDEFDERVSEAYASRTRAELTRALRELPGDDSVLPAPASKPLPALPSLALEADLPPALEAKARRRYRQRQRDSIIGFAMTNGIVIAIWAMTGGGYFWPAWVLLGTGCGFVNRLFTGPDKERDAIRAELKREAKRQEKRGLSGGTAS